MFRRQKEWFLTFERVTSLSAEQDDLANEIVHFVVEWVRSWHEENRDASKDLTEARTSWEQILRMMGSFRRKLKSNFLEQDDREGKMTISTEEEGVELEMWATSCETLGQCRKMVALKILTGSFNSQEDQE
jgi:hypothetical protein